MCIFGHKLTLCKMNIQSSKDLTGVHPEARGIGLMGMGTGGVEIKKRLRRVVSLQKYI